MPPSRYLGLPWKPWGETDFWLTQGWAAFLELLCPCGSGQFREDCTNEELAGRWQVVTETHHAQASIAEFQRERGDDLPAGTWLGVRMLAEGEKQSDPFEFDPAAAEAENAAMRKRFNLD